MHKDIHHFRYIKLKKGTGSGQGFLELSDVHLSNSCIYGPCCVHMGPVQILLHRIAITRIKIYAHWNNWMMS